MRYLEEFNCALLFSVTNMKRIKIFSNGNQLCMFCYYGHSPAQIVIDVEYPEFFE